ncbi:MAG: Chitinase, partial [uncultured Sulfurovum sp.]
MKKTVMVLMTVLLLASCGSSSEKAKEILTHLLKLIGIPQSVVVNICQDDNGNGRCDVGELHAKVGMEKGDSVQTMWNKVVFDEEGQYLLTNYDPTKNIIMELRDGENFRYDNGDLALKYKP